MNDKGFVKINRSILDWEWWDDIKTFRLFFYCIVRANYQDTRYKGIELKRGQFLTSYDSLIAGTGLTLQEIRTRLEWLEESGEINRQLTGKKHNANGSIITIVNYDKFQDNRQITFKQHSNNIQITTDKNIKNIKEREELFLGGEATDKNNTSSLPTEEECQAYFKKQNYKSDYLGFYLYNAQRGWKNVADWKMSARLWEHRANNGDEKDEQYSNGYGSLPEV